jgi:hypothetical protein
MLNLLKKKQVILKNNLNHNIDINIVKESNIQKKSFSPS